MVIVEYIRSILDTFFRRIYWFYRSSCIKFKSSPKIDFPFIVEGKGKIKVGSKCTIGKRAKIGAGTSSELIIGDNLILEKECTILLGIGFTLNIGECFKLGQGARLYVKNDWTFGNNISIETNCSIFAREPDRCGKLVIGNNSNIGDFTIMDMVDDVTIGNDVAIGPNCTIYTHDHIYTDKSKPAWKGGLVSRPITIEDGAWIGSGVTILPGVTVGKRAVVAAGSVVTKDVKPESVWGGIPAKWIKDID